MTWRARLDDPTRGVLDLVKGSTRRPAPGEARLALPRFRAPEGDPFDRDGWGAAATSQLVSRSRAGAHEGERW